MKSEICPHVCPECGYPAYIGMNQIECTWLLCRNFSGKTSERFLAERLEAERLQLERWLEWGSEDTPFDDEDTLPGGYGIDFPKKVC